MDAIMNLLGKLDPAALLPNISTVVWLMEFVARGATLIIPALILGFGLLYFFKPIQEANHIFGFRAYFGMGSVEAWRFAQRLAGFVYMILGGVMTLSMLIVNIVLIGKGTIALLTTVAISLVIEAILVGLAVLAINIYLAVLYDQDGYRRDSR